MNFLLGRCTHFCDGEDTRTSLASPYLKAEGECVPFKSRYGQWTTGQCPVHPNLRGGNLFHPLMSIAPSVPYFHGAFGINKLCYEKTRDRTRGLSFGFRPKDMASGAPERDFRGCRKAHFRPIFQPKSTLSPKIRYLVLH